MPYLNYFFCDRCGPPANLDVDYVETINSYIADGRKSAVLDDRTLIWDYMVYVCRLCGDRKRYTFRDVEERVRVYLASKSREYKVYIESVVEAQDTEVSRREGLFFAKREDQETRKRLKDMYEK